MVRRIAQSVAACAVCGVVTSCVLSVGIGGKRCDERHACISGYVCTEGVCVALGDLRDAGDQGFADAGFTDAGDVVDAGFVDAGFGDAGVDAGFDAGEPDGGTCVPAADGIERCNNFDDLCTGNQDVGCDNGCDDDGTFPGAFISVCSNALTFDDARAVCQSRGLDLAVLEDAKFNDAVMSDVGNDLGTSVDAWIGLTDEAVEGNFVWVDDGTATQFEAFDKGQPNNFGGTQDCVVTDDFRWNDVDCTLTNAFVCAKKPPPPPRGPFCTGTPVDNDGDGVDCRTDCDDGNPAVHPGAVENCFDRVDNDCDGVVDEACSGCVAVGAGGALLCERPTTWAQARDRCHNLNMQLAKVEAQNVEDAINTILVNDGLDNVWLGLNDRATASTANPVDVWDDGSPLGPLQFFGDGQPSDPASENCFTFRDTDPAGVDGGPSGDGVYEWHDVPCTDVGDGYVCTP